MAIQIRDRSAHGIRVLLRSEPSTDLSPGSTIALRCEVHNQTEVTICGALLRFILPSDIVIAHADQMGIVLPPIEPNAQTIVTLDVAVHCGALDGAELLLCAVLAPADGSLQRSNTVAVRICSRPRLHGPGTNVNVSLSDVPGQLRVEAQITNDGTAGAQDITIDLPAPVGTQPVSPADVTTFWLDQLDAGQTRRFAYAVRVTAASARSVRATDASMCARDMRRIALPASRPLALSPGTAPPSITVTRDGRRFHIAIDVRNAGPGPARDVALDVRWPEAYACSHFSLTSNGARVATFERVDAWTRARVNDDGLNVVIAAIDAARTVAFEFDLYALSGASSGLLTVEMHVDDALVTSETTLLWSPRRQIDLRLVCAPDQWVDIGTSAALIVELINHGDDDEMVSLDVGGAPAHLTVDGIPMSPNAPIALAAGMTKQVTIDVHVPIALRDGERIALVLTAGAANVPAARIECTIVARDRVWIDSRFYHDATDDGGIIELTHRGATPARNGALVCADGTRITIGDIEPNTVRRIPIPERQVAQIKAGAELVMNGRHTFALEPVADGPSTRAGLDAVLRVAASATPGSTIPVACYIVCELATRILRIRAQPLAGASEVAGSLTLDGAPLRDAGDAAVICVSSPAGLILRDIAAGSQIDLMWSVRVDATACDPLGMRLELDADGRRKIAFARSSAPAIPLVTHKPTADFNTPLQRPQDPTENANAVFVAAPEPIRTPNAAVTNTLPKSTLPGHGTDAQSESTTLFLDLDPLLVDRCIELLRDGRKPFLLAHVALLRALLPTADARLDVALNAALAVARDAFELLFDRLAIIARLPNEPMRLQDRNDRRVRSALIALFEALARTPTARDIPMDERTMPLCATIGRDVIRRQHALLAGAAGMNLGIGGGTIGLLLTNITRFPALGEALSCYAEALGRVESEASPSADTDVNLPAIEMLEIQRGLVADTLATIRLNLWSEQPICMPADIPAVPGGVILDA